jgi:hypothetical protein
MSLRRTPFAPIRKLRRLSLFSRVYHGAPSVRKKDPSEKRAARTQHFEEITKNSPPTSSPLNLFLFSLPRPLVNVLTASSRENAMRRTTPQINASWMHVHSGMKGNADFFEVARHVGEEMISTRLH